MKGCVNLKVVNLNEKRIFNSVSSAVRFYEAEKGKGLSVSSIISCCRGDLASAGKTKDGIKLTWCSLESLKQHKELPCIEKSKFNWVVCEQDGLIWNSIKEACDFYGIHPVRVSQQLAGVRPSAGKNKMGNPLTFIRWEDFN